MSQVSHPPKKGPPSVRHTRHVWHTSATDGDLYGPAMNVQTVEEAVKYLTDLTRWTVLHHGGSSYEEAWNRHLALILHYAEYFDEGTQLKIKRLFRGL